MPVDRNPWTYRGQPESGGRLSPRSPATSSHPTHRGRLYVVGHGWLWLSGWQQADGAIRLAAEPMTSAHVDQYCTPPGSARDTHQVNQAQQRAPHQAQLGELIEPGARAALTARAPPHAHARERARPPTPPGGPSGAGSGPSVSHTVPASPNRDLAGEAETAKTAARVEVARAGRRTPSSKPDEETTAAAMEELNDDIPF